MKWSAISTHEQATAPDQRSELLQIEFAELHDVACRSSKSIACRSRNSGRGVPVGRARAEDQPSPLVSSRQASDQLDEEYLRPSAEGIPGADVHHDHLVPVEDTCVSQAPRHPGIRIGVERHLDRVLGRGRSAALPSRYRLE